MPSFDSDPFSYLRARAMGEIASLNTGVGGFSYRAGDVVASSVAMLGGGYLIPVGNDTTGDGTPTNPYLTIDKAYTMAVAGKTVWLNGDPASPTDYRHATFLNIAKGVTIDAVRPWGASISSTTTAARAVNVAGTSGAAVIFGRIIIDGRGLCPASLTVSQQTTLMNLWLLGTRLRGFTQAGHSIAATSKVGLLYDSADVSNTTTDVLIGALLWTGADTGSSAIIRNSTGTISSQTGSTQAMWRIGATAAGVTAQITGNTFNLTVKSGLAGSGTHFCVLTENVVANVDRNTITVAGGTALRAVYPINLTPAISGTAYSISGSSANDNTLNHNALAGIILMLGQDVQGTVADGVTSTIEALRNVCTGSAAGVANALHGILAGGGVTATVKWNRVTTTALGLVDKVGQGCLFAANLVIDSSLTPLRLKGSQNGIYRQNTFIQSANYTGDFVLATNNDVPTVTNTVNALVEANIFYTPSLEAGGQFVNEAASQGVTYVANDYYGVGAATSAWSVGASNIVSLAAWQAAKEASALGVDPAFVAPEYTPSAASLVAGIARSASVLTDVRGRAYADPATIGAFAA